VATLKSYPAVYAKEAYEGPDLKHLMPYIWAVAQRAAVVNIFELSDIAKWIAGKREESVGL
jgi:hypothetical protein